ncbi:MAG: carboxypeptidase M32 [Armatimonadetes bacterium]|nr:carboxypeptidase M32 [Armatimonadota bacterium]
MAATSTNVSAITDLMNRFYDINALRSALASFEWDQQVLMPQGGASARAEHIGILSRMEHDLVTDDTTRTLIERAAGAAETDDERALVRITKREYDIATKIPTSLVAEKSRLGAIAHESWVKARANNDYKSFAPQLKRMFEIVKEEADALGWKNHPYDALTDQYEEGATHADWTRMFEGLKSKQIELVRRIAEKPTIDDSAFYGNWDLNAQRKFGNMLVQAIGFDMDRGRQDEAAHPFCSGWSVGDVRLTTRYKDYLPSGIFGSLHEAGHGMYEQGSPMAWDRSPLAGGVSLGIHESQSRTWENIVGRSRGFWKFFGPKLRETFPGLKLSGEEFYRAINKVEPSFIRVEADEVTYNLHVLVRFEIESEMLTGKLTVEDLPEAWNAKYTEYLGITPKTYSEGCLQDVHWSMGSIGYFPTYTMGNLLSYQIWNVLEKDLGDTASMIESGNFKPILNWLQEKVYSQGKKYPPKELVMRVTGKPVGAEDYLEGLTKKYTEIYSL